MPSNGGPMSALESMPWLLLIALALLMALAPFGQTPHLVEKLGMLFNGTLTKPLDIFDLFLHIAPIFAVVIKGWGEFGS